MELWIRSQDKNNLIKVYDIWIDNTDMIDKSCVSIMANSNFSFELGTYKSKERALEVLDEIQEYLKAPKVMINEFGNIDYLNVDVKIYEMPKE